MAPRAHSLVRPEVIAPFSYAASLHGFHGRNVERTFSGYKLQSVLIERGSEVSDPTQYCFDLNLTVPFFATPEDGVGSRPSTIESCRFRDVTSPRRWMLRTAGSHI